MILRAILDRIPPVSAEGAALFRIIFGSATVLAFARSPIDDRLVPWIWIPGILFVAGALTPVSFAAFTAGAIWWGVAYSSQAGHHPVSALLVALVCLLPSRWGDAWSVDALWRRGRRAAPREYGYTVWAPGVMLALALFAAAFSKLSISGIDWVVTGAVKYHFVTDAPNAVVDWGVRLGVIPWVAVALSLGTILVEGLALPVAILAGWIARAVIGLAIAMMLLGFWLFQGVLWPAWWILLLSFAPWHLWRRSGEASAAGALRHVQLAVLAAALAVQVAASLLRIEAPPMISAYDMYSKTYDSPAQYPADGGTAYYLVGELTDGMSAACRLDDDDARGLAAVPPAAFASGVDSFVENCFNDRDAVRAVALEERRPDVDWAAGRYRGEARRILAGPVPLNPAETP